MAQTLTCEVQSRCNIALNDKWRKKYFTLDDVYMIIYKIW